MSVQKKTWILARLMKIVGRFDNEICVRSKEDARGFKTTFINWTDYVFITFSSMSNMICSP